MSDPKRRIYEQAYRVRMFLETEGKDTCCVLQRFPRGCCGHASDMLGEWLVELGLQNIEYVAGERDGTPNSHAWLEIDGLVVDITYDQFDVKWPVFVARLGEFHNSWQERHRRDPKVEYPPLKRLYATMTEQLSNA